MTKPYYTSTDLIEAVKRKASIPISQNTFSEEDILRFANEEMFLAQVPSILEYHEEYLVHELEVPLRPNVSRYPIPSRAIGMKFRDVFYRDINGNLVEMSKINPDDRAVFQGSIDTGRVPYHYYLQANSLVLTPEVGAGPRGSLVFVYFLRPNSLVLTERAAISTSFSKTLTLTANLTAGDEIRIGNSSNLVLIAGTDFVIAGSAALTATNIVTAMNLDMTFSASNSAEIIIVTYADRTTAFTTTSPNITIQSTITLNFASVPSNILNGGYVDILQTEGGHSMLQFDVRLGSNVVGANYITFNESNIHDEFVVGDYICSTYECIIPQIPSDLHNLLAERTCARVLEAIGDQDGLKIANAKIMEQEAKQTALIDNRVEGSPLKVYNSRSLLRTGRRNRTRGY